MEIFAYRFRFAAISGLCEVVQTCVNITMKLLYYIVDDDLYYCLALIWLLVVAFALGLVVGFVCVSL